MNKVDMDINILVIDDDAMVRALIADYLRSFGFSRIHEAPDGSEALKIVRDKNQRLDLILSDWEMQGIDGLDVLKAVRRMPMRHATSFIMITSQTPQERQKITWARHWRVSSYIVKPFRGEVLKEKIWSVLGWSDEACAG